MEVGTEFKSWDEFEAALDEYQRTTHSVYTKKRTVPLKATDKCQQLKNKNVEYWYAHPAMALLL